MLGDGQKEVSIVSVVYPCGTVSVLLLSYFRLLVLILNLLILLLFYLLENSILKIISIRRGRGKENSLRKTRRRPDTRSRLSEVG